MRRLGVGILYILCRLRLRSVQFNEYETRSVWTMGMCVHEESIDGIAMMLIIIRVLTNAVAYMVNNLNSLNAC